MSLFEIEYKLMVHLLNICMILMIDLILVHVLFFSMVLLRLCLLICVRSFDVVAISYFDVTYPP
jgi:hypothetical protein